RHGGRSDQACLRRFASRRAHPLDGAQRGKDMAMNRLEAFRSLLRLLDREPVIANLGKNCYDLFVAGHRPENLYTWGAMGSVSSLGLGLALARPWLIVAKMEGTATTAKVPRRPIYDKYRFMEAIGSL